MSHRQQVRASTQPSTSAISSYHDIRSTEPADAMRMTAAAYRRGLAEATTIGTPTTFSSMSFTNTSREFQQPYLI